MHTNMIGTSNFRNGLNQPFSSTGYIFENKTVEISPKM